jgi:hypothetical protein
MRVGAGEGGREVLFDEIQSGEEELLGSGEDDLVGSQKDVCWFIGDEKHCLGILIYSP